MQNFASRIRSWFRSGSRSVSPGELDDELRAHIQLRADDLERSGLPRAEAERRARIEFGGYQKHREDAHEALAGSWTSVFLQDLRVALRILRKSPGFTATAVITLALAIGANAVVFGLFNALILRPLDVPQSDSLYCLEQEADFGYQSYPTYLDLRDRNRTFDGLAAFTMLQTNLDTGNNPSHAWTVEASGNYFDVLRLQPFLGRFFHGSDEHGPDSAPYVVLGWSYWHTHFQGDPSIVGRVVQLDKHPFTIIGVAPPSFHGTLSFFTPDLFVPMVDQEEIEGWSGLKDRGNRWIFDTLGHLKPGVTPAQATADLNAIEAWLEKTYPKEIHHRSFALGRPNLYGSFMGRPVLGFVAGLTLLSVLILLAACANLGSLFAARAADRAREVALRLALGSSRSRILRQLFTEAVLISLAGGTLGLFAGVALLRAINSWQPLPRMPVHVPASPDARVYVVALVLALVSGFLFGLVPVRQVLRSNPWAIVKVGNTGAIGRRITARDVLLVVQIALCAVLVTASMVAFRGLVRSLHSNFGFEPRGALVADIDFGSGGYRDERVTAMQKRILDAVQAIPGVTAAATTNEPPLNLGGERKGVFRDQTATLQASNAAASSFMYIVSSDYFRASGTILAQGRLFTDHDDRHAPLVAIVNHQFARVLFGDPATAVGRYFKLLDGSRILVVGLAEDGKYFNLTEDPQPAMFLPLLQHPWSQTSLIVRSSRDPQEMTSIVRNKIRELDPGLPVEIQTWSRMLDAVLFPARVATLALGVLGLMGGMLSITGIFGMAAYSVSRRVRELGIRIALGARRREVLESALGRSVRLLGVGSAAGLVLGVLASRVLASVVWQATPRDPLVMAAVVVAMALLGLIATWIPAQRALSLDPLVLLHEE